jgi:hypothetical protein
VAQAHLNLWMDVMRGMEPVIGDYERLFDVWGAGGVDGLVIGPMMFEEQVASFDPDPRVYRRLGLEPPMSPAHLLPEKRAPISARRGTADRGVLAAGWLRRPAARDHPGRASAQALLLAPGL